MTTRSPHLGIALLLLAAATPLLAEGYESAGRRDPFRVYSSVPSETRCATGLACATVDEVQLQGTLRTGQTWTALATVRAKAYTLHVGDKLIDGEVAAIQADGVAFSRIVTDPGAVTPVEEVWRPIRLGPAFRVTR